MWNALSFISLSLSLYQFSSKIDDLNVKIFAILNPKSQNAKEVHDVSKSIIGVKNIQVYNNVSEITSSKPQIIACFGGDGTIHKIVNDVIDANLNKKCALAVFPCGSSNGVCASLNIFETKDALESLLNHPISVPLMKITFANQVKHAVMGVGWGIIADHDYYAENSLRFLGCLRSILIPMLILAKFTRYAGSVTITLMNNKKKVITANDFFMVQVMKMGFIASDLLMFPDCDAFDSVLHVMIIRLQNVSRMQIIRLMWEMNNTSRSTNYEKYKFVQVYKCKKVTIKPKTNKNFSLDGEYHECDKVNVEIGEEIRICSNLL